MTHCRSLIPISVCSVGIIEFSCLLTELHRREDKRRDTASATSYFTSLIYLRLWRERGTNICSATSSLTNTENRDWEPSGQKRSLTRGVIFWHCLGGCLSVDWCLCMERRNPLIGLSRTCGRGRMALFGSDMAIVPRQNEPGASKAQFETFPNMSLLSSRLISICIL